MFVKHGSSTVGNLVGVEDFHSRIAIKKIVEYDPSFVYMEIRAVTADKPNNNGDCFPHDELCRIDPVLKRPVWASFIGKGVYVNHTGTDDPMLAKGVILDAEYVTANPEDKHIKLLVAIDKKKDPVFAQGVERGLINKFSMGASVQYTKCSICGNIARSTNEFCDHIAKYKMQECMTPSGERKLAYEYCYGVIYNEVSAVSSPADERAVALAKVANTIGNPSGTVKETNTMHKAAELPEGAADKAPATPPPPAPPEKQHADGDAAVLAPNKEQEKHDLAVAAEVLSVVRDLLLGAIPSAEAVETIDNAMKGDVMAQEEKSVDTLTASVKNAVKEKVLALLKERQAASATEKKADAPAAEAAPAAEEAAATEPAAAETAQHSAATKTAKKPKFEYPPAEGPLPGQYPHYDVQDDPKQHHTKPHKGRPLSDFAKDKKEYAKLYNITASFVPHEDRRRSAWVVSDSGRPLFMVTAAGAWGKDVDANYGTFSDRKYGETLIRHIAENGLDETIDVTNGVVVPESLVVTPAIDADKLVEAADRKAEDLAQKKFEEFKATFLDRIRLAFQLQDKNIIDNPIRAALYDLARSGAELNTNTIDDAVPTEVVQAHIDTAVNKALEYVSMAPEAFNELRASVESMPKVRVASTDAPNPDQDYQSALASYRARASANAYGLGTVKVANSLSGNQDAEVDRLRTAIRSSQSTLMQHVSAIHRLTNS
jgi:hypothetical protein